MNWRVLIYLRMRWHEIMADLAARRAGAALNRATRHIDAADRLGSKLMGE